MRAWILAIAALALAALAGYLLLVGSDASSPAPAVEGSAPPVPAAGRAGAAPPAPATGEAAPAVAGRPGADPGAADDVERDRPRGALDNGPAWATLPASYPAKETAPGVVAISLSGAPVSVTSWASGAPPPPLHEVHGRVTEEGRGVGGVTVGIGDRLVLTFGHLMGRAVAVTDASGGFTAQAPDGVRWAVALGPRAWSAMVAVVDGQPIELALGAAAGLEVTVREDGAPLDADLSLAIGDRALVGTVTAADGVFRFAALPPGPITLEARARTEFATGGDVAAPIALDLRRGEVVRRAIELTSANATVAVVPALADGATASTVEFALLDGAAPASLAELRQRAPSMPLFGGRDAASTYQFHRVAPAGPRVACAVAGLRGVTDDAPPVRRWGCAPVVVPATGVVEVTVTIDRAAE